jgi:hypothetical protein
MGCCGRGGADKWHDSQFSKFNTPSRLFSPRRPDAFAFDKFNENDGSIDRRKLKDFCPVVNNGVAGTKTNLDCTWEIVEGDIQLCEFGCKGIAEKNIAKFNCDWLNYTMYLHMPLYRRAFMMARGLTFEYGRTDNGLYVTVSCGGNEVYMSEDTFSSAPLIGITAHHYSVRFSIGHQTKTIYTDNKVDLEAGFGLGQGDVAYSFSFFGGNHSNSFLSLPIGEVVYNE